MIAYITIILIITLFSFLYNLLIINKNGIVVLRYKKIFLSLSGLLLIIALSLRHSSVGVDLTGYLNFFHNIDFNNIGTSRFEIGYKIFNVIIKKFSSNDQIFLFVLAIFTIVPVIRFIYNYSKMPFLSIVIYLAFNFYAFTFSGLRQALAYGIILISFDFVLKKRFFKFLIVVILASLFHTSAIVFIFAYPLSKIRINYRTVSMFLFLNVLIFIFKMPIFNFFISIFYNNYSIVTSTSYNWLLLSCVIVFIGLFLIRGDLIKDSSVILYLPYLLVGLSLMIFASVGTNVMRVVDYYYIFIILFIPEVLFSLRKSKYYLITLLFTVLIILFVFYLLFLGDGYGIIPYKFFWML